MAPEVVRGEKYGRKADIWSVGATVVEMLTGKHPWPATEHHFATFTQIATAKGGPPVPTTVSRELRDFLNLCFARWAGYRPSSAGCVPHKRHAMGHTVCRGHM